MICRPVALALPLLLGLLAATHAGCSSRQAYEAGREHLRQQCLRLPPSQYQQCLEQDPGRYEDYQRQREEVRRP